MKDYERWYLAAYVVQMVMVAFVMVANIVGAYFTCRFIARGGSLVVGVFALLVDAGCFTLAALLTRRRLF